MIVPSGGGAEELFQRAKSLAAPERRAFLDAACGADAALRSRVDALLRTYDDSAHATATVAGVPAARVPEAHAASAAMGASGIAPEAPPAQIGPYKLLERIGEGGFGEVWAAEQREPIRRKVALKVVKAGMDTREVLARFEAERQALALLDHPNIAKVHDAGVTPSGRPYFVMEHVAGLPIREYCDSARLAIRRRLALFIDVCQAVQHAHQKGIIHRDLKPSNILVTHLDGNPVPKVIDFGIAKATTGRLTERTLYTETGRLMGTPEYMAPEQAGTDGLDVDTRADIYSLGAILYELLTGTLPFDAKVLRSAGYDGMARLIREMEPPKPSTRLGTLAAEGVNRKPGESADEIARTHGTEFRLLQRELRGDLDWITLKALEKDRTRRYETAQELAADLRRFLADEPVLARSPSGVYRLRKFARKHRRLVTAAALLVATLVAGLLATSWALREALVARELAVKESDRADANSRAAEARYEELIGLADLKRLAEVESHAEDLWPAVPDRIPAMERWLAEEARPLAQRVPLHLRTRETLRLAALPYDDAQRRGDLESHPQRALLERKREKLAELAGQGEDATRDGDSAARDAAVLEREVLDLERSVTARRTWKFADAELQWRHDTVTELVERLEAFASADPARGAVASVEARITRSREIDVTSVRGAEAVRSWTAALAEFRRLDGYDGVLRAPQFGLLPLGRDARSGLWEFWHVPSGDRPAANPDSAPTTRWLITRETGLVLVLIPSGTVRPSRDGTRPRNEPPPPPGADVAVDAFFLSKYEMTQGQWQRLAGRNPSEYAPGRDLGDGKPITWVHPVENVSWIEAERMLRRWGLTLPTEPEWEMAARAGTTTEWWTGAERESLRGNANLADESSRLSGFVWKSILDWPGFRDEFPVHAPVGSFPANPFGLHEVLGNVWEWTLDDVHDSAEGDDPAAGRGKKGMRGGGYASRADDLGASRRGKLLKYAGNRATGLRPALSLAPSYSQRER